VASRASFSIAALEPALVLHWPSADGGLWDPEVSELVEDLENRLEVFVTSSGSGRGALGLSDATSAARFMGCRAAVVVAPEGHAPAHDDLVDAAVRLDCPLVVVETPWTAGAIAAAYHLGRQHSLRAA
jgi:hypothetical protein